MRRESRQTDQRENPIRDGKSFQRNRIRRRNRKKQDDNGPKASGIRETRLGERAARAVYRVVKGNRRFSHLTTIAIKETLPT